MVVPRPGALGDYTRLTPTESRLLGRLATYRTLPQIAVEFKVAHSTVKTHALSLYRKLGVSDRASAVHRAIELGLVIEPPRDEFPPDGAYPRSDTSVSVE